MDCVWLRPIQQLPEEIKDLPISTPYIGEELISIGLSSTSSTTSADKPPTNQAAITQSIQDRQSVFPKISFDISNVCSDVFDDRLHHKTGMKTRPGDSGSPLFDYYNGAFIGMIVASQHELENPGHFGGMGCFLSAPLILSILRHSYSKSVSK